MWPVGRGALLGNSDGNSESVLRFGGQEFSDFELRFDLRLDHGSGIVQMYGPGPGLIGVAVQAHAGRLLLCDAVLKSANQRIVEDNKWCHMAIANNNKPEKQIDYIEFPMTDRPATQAFYQMVFGWKFEDYGPEYTSFSDGRLAGGFTTGIPASSGGPLVIVYANDLEAALSSVRAAGGIIVKDIFAFPGGRRFHFSDPNGNVLAVWSDKS